MCVCVGGVRGIYPNVHEPHVCGAHRSQKQVSDLLGLELQTGVSTLCVPGSDAGSCAKKKGRIGGEA